MAYSRYVTEMKDENNNVYGVMDEENRNETNSLKSAIKENNQLFFNGNITSFDIVSRKAIAEDGTIETNSDYSYADSIGVITGRYKLTINKTDLNAGITRVHGYKNGVWQKQITIIPAAVQTATTSVVFDVDGSEIDAIKISYNNTTTTLVSLKTNGVEYENPKVMILNVHFEKGSYSNSNNRYGLFSSGNTLLYVINSYPIILNASTQILIPATKILNRNISLAFRNSNGETLENTQISNVTNNIIKDIPNGVYYLDIEISDPSDTFNCNEPIAVLFYNAVEPPKESKRIYRNSGDPIINPFSVGGMDGLLSCMCYMLPPNYRSDGKKVPMILWFDGSANYPSLTSSFSSNKLPGLSYMRDEGYVIMQVFAWGAKYAISCPGCGSDMPYPTHTCFRVIRSAIEYMVDRYNIDPNDIHVASKSFGGIISSYFVTKPIWNFRSIGMFAPCIDVLSMRGRFLGGRLALISDLNFQGDYVDDFKDITTTGETQTGVENYYFSERCQHVWLDNFEKLISINPAWTFLGEGGYNEKYLQSLADARSWWGGNKFDTNLYNHTERHRNGAIPCKIWIGTQDSDTPYQIMVEYIEQLKNSGCFAVARLINGGGHSSADFSGYEPITTKLGIEYESVALGWRENIEWIRLNSEGELYENEN